MFWFGHNFELPLLIQSFVMIAGMLAMMRICVLVRDKNSYIISTIGQRQSPRSQSSMGKLKRILGLSSDSVLDSQSGPIYLLTADSSTALLSQSPAHQQNNLTNDHSSSADSSNFNFDSISHNGSPTFNYNSATDQCRSSFLNTTSSSRQHKRSVSKCERSPFCPTCQLPPPFPSTPSPPPLDLIQFL